MAQAPRGFVPDAPVGFVPDAPAPAAVPQKGIFGLPRSEQGLGRIINFLGNDIFFLGNPPQTAGDVGMVAGLLAVPLAGPALTRMGMSTVARGFAKLPGFMQRIALGAVGDELASDLTGRQIGQGFREGAQGAAVGEAVGLGLRGGLKMAGGIGRAAATVGTYIGKQVPGVKGVLTARERAAKVAERAKRVADAKIEREFKAKEAAFEASQKKRETALQNQYDDLVSQWQKEKNAVTKRNMEVQMWHVDREIQNNLAARARGVAGQIGEEVGKIVPREMRGPEGAPVPVMPFQTPEEMSRAVIFRNRPGGTRSNLGKHQEAKLAETESAFGDFTFDLPMLAKPDPIKVRARELAEALQRKALTLGPSDPLPDYLARDLDQLVGMKTRFTPRELMEELGRIGSRGWTKTYLRESTKPGVEWRTRDAQVRAAASAQARAAGLEGPLKEILAGRKSFSVGNAMLDLMAKKGVFKRGGEEVLPNLRTLQESFREHAADLRARMLPDEFQAVRDALFNGKDITLSPGPYMGKGGRLMQATPEILDIAPPPPGQPMPPKHIVPPQTGPIAMPPQRPAAPKPLAPSRPWTYPFSVSELGQVYLDMTMANNMRIAPVEPMSEEKGRILGAISQARKPPETAQTVELQPGAPSAGPSLPPQ